ncbi:hypothetical protein GYA54_02390 [Candidatus Kuenenbacteria bacterium]|nr:hypothetical protein [Candidatus Kuenenbacteria bacterium]
MNQIKEPQRALLDKTPGPVKGYIDQLKRALRNLYTLAPRFEVFLLSGGYVRVIVTVVNDNNYPVKNHPISLIMIDGHDWVKPGDRATADGNGQYSLIYGVPSGSEFVTVAVEIEGGKGRFQQILPVPQPPETPAPPKPGYLNVVIDSQAAKDNKVACMLAVLTTKDGDPIDGQVEITCVRRLSVDSSAQANKVVVDVAKVKSSVIELFPEEGDEQVELTFHLDGTGMAIPKSVKVVKPEPAKEAPKPGWLDVKIGEPDSKGRAKGRIIVKTAPEGELITGKVRVSGNRPFAIAANSLPSPATQNTEANLAIANGEMLIEIEMSNTPGHMQQNIFFVLLGNGMEIKKLLVRR